MPLLSEEELRERIVRLAAIERGSASAGERRAAEEIVAEMAGLGWRARIEEEPAHGTYWWPLGLITGIAALAGASRRRGKTALAGLSAAAAAVDDLRIGPRVARRALPRRTTANVVAEIGPPDAPRTVLFVAHHDAAHTGLVFHPELPRALGRRLPWLLERTNTTPPTMWPAVAGPLLVGLGALLGVSGARRLGTVLSAGFALAMADIGSRPVVPGANDNLTGVAVLLSLARALRQEAPAGLRVILLSTGSEESLMEGMAAYARRHFPSLAPDRTSVICVDTVGSPRLTLLEGEGMLGIRDYPPELTGLVQGCAERLEIPLLRGLRFRNATDGVVALRAGYPSAMLGSVDRFRLPTDYHWPTDTPDNVDYGSVADAARLCLAVARQLSEEGPRHAHPFQAQPTRASRA
ncbi:MAG TPA: M28 family peptidase [Thermoleophilaceae bacterium]|nr:M28 family peptidase [Thermoleophilaceae bacterium]